MVRRALSYLKSLRRAAKKFKNITLPTHHIPEITAINCQSSNYSDLRYNLLVPSIEKQHLFGGIDTALQFMELICSTARDGRIITTDSSYAGSPVHKSKLHWQVATNSESDKVGMVIVPFGDRANKNLPVRDRDVFIATAWWTAFLAFEIIQWQKKVFGVSNKLVYLIQDYEPGFYPHSSRYLLAKSTYENSDETIAIFNTSVLEKNFAAKGYRFHLSTHFEPHLHPQLVNFLGVARPRLKEKKILVYVRFDVPRNASELAILGIQQWARSDHRARDWEILSVGGDHPTITIDQDIVIKSLGKLDLEEYANLLWVSSIGISLMVSAHSSYPPLEMASFGLHVITNQFENKDLGDRGEYIHALASVTPKSIGESIAKLIDLSDVRNEKGYSDFACSVFLRSKTLSNAALETEALVNNSF